MNFKIASRKNIQRYSRFPHKEHAIVISTTDKFSPKVKVDCLPDYNGICAVKQLKFNDVSLGIPHSMTIEDAVAITNFVKKYEHCNIDTLIVHCEVGVCRSAGICAAIMRHYGYNYKKLFASKTFKPNIGCFKLVCEAFGTPVSDAEVNQLKELNLRTWENRTTAETLAFGIHAFKSANWPHILRHAKIKWREKNLKNKHGL